MSGRPRSPIASRTGRAGHAGHTRSGFRVYSWSERIILEPIPHIPEPLADAEAGVDIDVPVVRRSEGK